MIRKLLLTLGALLLSTNGLTACYTNVRSARPVPVSILAKDGRPPPTAQTCPDPPRGPTLAADPQAAAAHNQEAIRLAEENRLSMAVLQWEEATRLDRTNADYAYNLALAQEDLGRPDQAFQAYCAYLSLRPSAPDALEIRSRLALLWPYPADVDDVAASHFRVGTEFAKEGQWDNAKEALDDAEDAAPTWADIRFNRALVWEGLQEYDRSADDLEDYLRLLPAAGDAQQVLDKISALRIDRSNQRKFSGGKTLLLVTGLLLLGASAYAAYYTSNEEGEGDIWYFSIGGS
ncbi:MAG: hypothetical protein HKO65_06565 [Gemmatimonadetes bacterium]|nr:hypothetical protein [Gemmatimonadota bacterium]NNM04751.1 hypothetical protein [Gemmatimonadota bacterium]